MKHLVEWIFVFLYTYKHMIIIITAIFSFLLFQQYKMVNSSGILLSAFSSLNLIMQAPFLLYEKKEKLLLYHCVAFGNLSVLVLQDIFILLERFANEWLKLLFRTVTTHNLWCVCVKGQQDSCYAFKFHNLEIIYLEHNSLMEQKRKYIFQHT